MSYYRDKLVSLIKASGQELIDRAETLVDENLSMICDTTIILSFPCDDFPKMEITTEVVNKHAIDVLKSDGWKKANPGVNFEDSGTLSVGGKWAEPNPREPSSITKTILGPNSPYF